MRLEFRRLVVIGIIAIGLSACSTSTSTINSPIGIIQLGMYLDDVQDILGEGVVVDSEKLKGEFLVQTRAYPSNDGRTYVVYYVDDVVRRWELKERVPTASTAQPQ